MDTVIDVVGKTTRVILPEGRVLAYSPRNDTLITWITSIMVYDRYRGEGFGQFLLSVTKAYLRSHHLLLEPVAMGGLEQKELEEWYLRNGFSFMTEEESFFICNYHGILLTSPRLMYSSPLRNEY